MSCGSHHDTPCSEVLARVYSYLDGELDKKLVGKSCGCEPVPVDLRAKVMGRIEQLCGELKATEAQTEAGSSERA
jgi:hypothetical protein